MRNGRPLLEAIAVSKTYTVGTWLAGRSEVRAVDCVSLALWPGETLGLVGESGCGKSTLARCLLRLTDISSGEVRFDGTDITHLGQRALRPLRRHMQIVFQDPSASLNPRRRTRDLIAEPLRVHERLSRAELRGRLVELMRLVGLYPEHLDRFPHEFSGGQRQRIGIARALALSPRLIVADEPVSALDVSIQAQIVNLLMDLQERLGLAYFFISHDLRIIRQVSQRMAVMYRGTIVEQGETAAIFAAPAHPYTAALMAAVPGAESSRAVPESAAETETASGPGEAAGCRYRFRCVAAQSRCAIDAPALHHLADAREVACHFPLSGPNARADRLAASREGAPHVV